MLGSIHSHICQSCIYMHAFRNFKSVCVTTSCLDGHPQKFIREKLENDQTSKILYLKNFPIYGMPLLIRLVVLHNDHSQNCVRLAGGCVCHVKSLLCLLLERVDLWCYSQEGYLKQRGPASGPREVKPLPPK